MKILLFYIYGHSNVLSTHRNTLEFTKDSNLSKKGDCIVGVRADYDLGELLAIVKNFMKIKITIKTDNLQEEIIAKVNKDFNDEHEIVIRKTNFLSKRTLGINADKSSFELNRELVKYLQNPENKALVEIRGIE